MGRVYEDEKLRKRERKEPTLLLRCEERMRAQRRSDQAVRARQEVSGKPLGRDKANEATKTKEAKITHRLERTVPFRYRQHKHKANRKAGKL